MNVDELCAEASQLSVTERGKLVERLLFGAGGTEYDVSDEEVTERVEDTRSGRVQDISYEQLVSGLDHLKQS